MGEFYITFHFKNIEYDDSFYGGDFHGDFRRPTRTSIANSSMTGRCRSSSTFGTTASLLMKLSRFPSGGLTGCVFADLENVAILGQRLAGIAPVIGGKDAREPMGVVVNHAAGLVKGDGPVLNGRLEVKGRVKDANLIRDVAVATVVLGNGPDARARGKLLDPFHDRITGIDAELVAEVNIGDGTGLAIPL